jgi:hypothetical protein
MLKNNKNIRDVLSELAIVAALCVRETGSHSVRHRKGVATLATPFVFTRTGGPETLHRFAAPEARVRVGSPPY